ncbi:xanthine dehydrogenase subunit D [Gottfriedia luciferensis]|uniref:Xanthine dehydrogenase subunit D n=1 Tax=Gottfriedia luciferensis TaxID=178774 RepID=A0ABX2ZWH4_9BACI|nr:xanthine dehydrogenase subunit D [Gottfriedia luciferensis]ODG94022.1 xanthine dehydrogenase subunit D [Gottfriedia luciferensis]
MRKDLTPTNKERRIRPDGLNKVTGNLKYLTDLSFPKMLYGKVLRSTEPHAEILSISIEEAEKISGVKAIVTYKDIPGLNGFGLIVPDQPVFCKDRVRYIGDAIAAIAADSEEIAEQALKLIKVEYRKLPVIDSPEMALRLDAPKLHEQGNILHQSKYQKGDVDEGFRECSMIIEETYELPRQMHAYMETEGGVIVPEINGDLTVYVGTQHGFKDRFQLARILNMPEETIRIISSPMGGSFGGKDELNIQPYGALLALKTKCPIKIHQSRSESVKSGLKRHPMKITMKTGVNAIGEIKAHKVKIIADTGAYATLGPAVLDFAIEHASGPYIISNIEIEGYSVFTNNGVAGEFRGFGGNQITFALEGQIDRIAEKLNMDPIEFRLINLRKINDLGPLGQKIVPTNSAFDVLNRICKTPVLNKNEHNQNWKVYGKGIAITMHGGGLGVDRIDPAGGRLSFTRKGKIEAAFGFEECGQGILAVIETLLIDEFNCSEQDINIIIGDTELVPISGSSTASRATSMVWHSLKRMEASFKIQVLELAQKVTRLPINFLEMGPKGIWLKVNDREEKFIMTYKELAQKLPQKQDIIVQTSFDFPISPDATVGGSHYLYSFASVLAQVEVDLLTGKTKIIGLDQVVAAGPVVNLLGYKGQIEGGGVMALGYTLMEDSIMEKGKYISDNFDTYLIPTICDVPSKLNVVPIENLVEEDSFGPRGVGEIGTVAVAPAIARAIFDATGCWINKLPISPEYLLQLINSRR